MKELICFIILALVFILIIAVFLICFFTKGDEEDTEDERDYNKYRHWHED